VTAFFAAAPKVAAITLMARLLYDPFVAMTDQWRQVIVALSAISMLVGAFAALLQTNLKRLMAYSSVTNMGFALMGLAAGGQNGVAASLLYMTMYLPATIGVFALILAMRRDGQSVEQVSDLAGLAQKRTWMAALFTLLLFSLAGIPPFAGFFGKLVVFQAAVGAGLAPLAVVGGVAAVIAAAYYLRLLAAIWFQPPAPAMQPASGAVILMASSAALLSFPVLVLALGIIANWANNAVHGSW
jgi:NADH-quinone oxidoreductase subunit N